MAPTPPAKPAAPAPAKAAVAPSAAAPEGANLDTISGKIEASLSDTAFEAIMADGKVSDAEISMIANQIGLKSPTPEQYQAIAQATQKLWEGQHKDSPGMPEEDKKAAKAAGNSLKDSMEGELSPADVKSTKTPSPSTSATKKQSGMEMGG